MGCEMGNAPQTWLDRLKNRPVVAAALAVAVAIGGSLSYSKQLVEAVSYFADLIFPPKLADKRIADSFSLGLLAGNILYYRSSPRHPQGPSRYDQLYRADVGSSRQILKDLALEFDPETLEPDPDGPYDYYVRIYTVCGMSAADALRQAIARKAGEAAAGAFYDGCSLRTKRFAYYSGYKKATMFPDKQASNREIQEFLKKVHLRYDVDSDTKKLLDSMALPLGELIDRTEYAIDRRLGVTVRGQLHDP